MTKKIRAAFRIHLSTLYVLVILASLLLWGNIVEYTGTGFVNAREYGTFHTFETPVRGWPMHYSVQFPGGHTGVTHWKMFGNIVIGLMIVSAVGYGCEWYILHRERNEPPKPQPPGGSDSASE